MEGRRAPGHDIAGGKDARDIELGARLDETSADRGTGEGSTGDGADDPRAPHRHGLDARGVAVAQRAVAMVLEAVYEQDFLDCSYGYRPGRSARQAVDAVHQQMAEWRGGWVLEVDVKSFFDTLNFGHLRRILSQRVRDGAIVRMVGKCVLLARFPLLTPTIPTISGASA